MLFIFVYLKPKFNFHLSFQMKWITMLLTPLFSLALRIYNLTYFTYLVCVLGRIAELKQKESIPPQNSVNPIGIKIACSLCCRSHQRSACVVSVSKVIIKVIILLLC